MNIKEYNKELDKLLDNVDKAVKEYKEFLKKCPHDIIKIDDIKFCTICQEEI